MPQANVLAANCEEVNEMLRSFEEFSCITGRRCTYSGYQHYFLKVVLCMLNSTVNSVDQYRTHPMTFPSIACIPLLLS